VLVSNDGFYIRFATEEIPMQKKTAAGVRCMKLSGEDYVDGVFYEYIDGPKDFNFRDHTIEFSRIKESKRDGKGTKLRL
jgi:DNA gyrase subunit A